MRKESTTELDSVGVFFSAVKQNNLQSVQGLIEAGADVNSRAGDKKNGVTPLMLAATRGFLEMVKLLVEQGADIHAKHQEPGRCGRPPMACTACDYARVAGRSEVAAYLESLVAVAG